MNIKIIIFSIVLGVFPGIVTGVEKNLGEQLTDAKSTLSQEQALNTELKQKLAEKEKTIATLKERAKSLDEEIATIKEEHGIEGDA